jgi:formate hydrogenlyase subunit 3/multisubunit Na+/H+ antiporter MnhD subunit
MVLLASVWLTWLATLVSNYRLVRCGPVALRAKLAPRLVNRPEFPIRLALHFLVNWSAIAITVGVAWYLREADAARLLAWLSLGAIGAIWLEFNLLHRQMNRARNLAVSSLTAAALALACIAILR